MQRHGGGVLPYRGFPGVPQLHAMSGPLPTGHFYSSSQGAPYLNCTNQPPFPV